jgi:glycosyltransferase involved in cell wall biosynthesis
VTGTPRLSVVIAAYDAQDTLGAQLDALRAQRPAWPWEVLVCDNGSTDGTRALVERHRAAGMPEVRVVDASARRGPAAARNIGVAAARGRLVAFCDADDVVGDGWVAAVDRGLATHRVVAGPFEIDRLVEGSPFRVTWSSQLHGLTRSGVLDGLVTAGAGNLAMHRSVFEEVDGFDEEFSTAEDDDLCLRMQLAGHPIGFEPGMLLHVRRRGGLRVVARQAFAYGRGHRLLEHRWALVAATWTAPGPAPRKATPEAPGSSGAPVRRVLVQAGRTLRLAARLWRPAKLADAVWKVSWNLGYRLTDTCGAVQLPTGAATRPS